MTDTRELIVDFGWLKLDDKWLKILLAAASVALGLVITITFYVVLLCDMGSMSPRAYQVVRMLLALGAGFIAGGLAGPFEITGNWQPITFKAGGPIGVAIFFYLVNPSGLSS